VNLKNKGKKKYATLLLLLIHTVLAAVLIDDLAAHDRADGSADDQPNDETLDQAGALLFFSAAATKWPHRRAL